MSELYLIESSLMRSIIEETLPNGLVDDEKISQMTEEEKKELYQKQKIIIQEFQKRSDQEISVYTSTLRNLNENLLLLRKNQLIVDNSEMPDKIDDSPLLDKNKDHSNVAHSPPRFFNYTRSVISHKRNFSVGVLLPKKYIKNLRPPFRH